MRIMSNLPALNASRTLSMNQYRMSVAMERLSSGYRINRAADDPAGLSISERMRAQIRGLQQSARNIQDGISLIQVAEGAMQEMHAMLQRMNELAVQASNGTYNDSDRKSMQKEFDLLRTAINDIAKNTQFNGNHLLNGGLPIHINTLGQNGHGLDLERPEVTSSMLGLTGLDISTQNGASDALSSLKTAMSTVSTERAKLGASQNRLEHTYNFVMNYVENLTAAESRIRDADMAKEMMELARARVLESVGLAILAQANSFPKSILKLLEI
ncbi:flagellin [Paenibacillus sp. NPDC057967]|uniref:flagellin n=1 Tax=Paenibacillus sp. NPDC057967 TaxID=3346293 RepID=UPI0036D97DB0